MTEELSLAISFYAFYEDKATETVPFEIEFLVPGGNLSPAPFSAQSLKLRVLINSHTVGVWKKHEERLVLEVMPTSLKLV